MTPASGGGGGGGVEGGELATHRPQSNALPSEPLGPSRKKFRKINLDEACLDCLFDHKLESLNFESSNL